MDLALKERLISSGFVQKRIDIEHSIDWDAEDHPLYPHKFEYYFP